MYFNNDYYFHINDHYFNHIEIGIDDWGEQEANQFFFAIYFLFVIILGCLKSKANVSIDPDYGRNMLGVLDETGILNYGEVFVQYSKDVSCGQTTKETVILQGNFESLQYLSFRNLYGYFPLTLSLPVFLWSLMPSDVLGNGLRMSLPFWIAFMWE